MLAGVCGTDPFLLASRFLRELRDLGFAGIQNFPTVGLIDGLFRENLEETGMGYRPRGRADRGGPRAGPAHDALRLQPRRGADDGRGRRRRRRGPHGADDGRHDRGADGRRPWRVASARCRRSPTPASRSGPTAWSSATAARSPSPEDAQYRPRPLPGGGGFYGASSMERLPTETAIAEQVRRFTKMNSLPVARDRASVRRPRHALSGPMQEGSHHAPHAASSALAFGSSRALAMGASAVRPGRRPTGRSRPGPIPA